MAELLAQHVGRDADGTEFLLDIWSDACILSVRRPGESTWDPFINLTPVTTVLTERVMQR